MSSFEDKEIGLASGGIGSTTVGETRDENSDRIGRAQCKSFLVVMLTLLLGDEIIEMK